jgi:hypothetical protein
LRQLDSRGDYTIVADLDEVGKPDSQQLLYRAARELPANVYRHARAGTVRVRLTRTGDRVVLTVADDGWGSTPAPGSLPDPVGKQSRSSREQTPAPPVRRNFRGARVCSPRKVGHKRAARRQL